MDRKLMACALAAMLVSGIAQGQDSNGQDGDSAATPAQEGAQAGAAEEAKPVRRRMPARLDEVIVTAQKREQDIQEVPISVSSISGEQIDASNMIDLNDLSRYTPNLKVQATGVANFIYIRGLGSGFNEGFDQSVGFFIDDIFYGRVHYIIAGLLDVERVEVLRGPQGTLFGKNTVAGAVSIHSGVPSDEWEAKADLSYGQRNVHFHDAYFNIPLWEDRVSFRGSILFTDREGYLFNTTVDEEDGRVRLITGRGKLRIAVTEDLTVTLSHLRNRGRIFNGIRAQLSSISQQANVLSRQFDPDVEANYDFETTALDNPTQGLQDSKDYIAHVDYEALNHNFQLILGTSSYDRTGTSDLDGLPIPIFNAELVQDYTQYTAELRVASPPGKFEYVAGLYYFWSDISDFTDVKVFAQNNVFDTLLNLTAVENTFGLVNGILNGTVGQLVQLLGVPAAQAQNLLNLQQLISNLTPNVGQFLERRKALFEQTSQSGSVFGQATWNVSDEIAVIAGARFGFDTKDVSFDHRIGNFATFPGPTVILGPVLDLQTFQADADIREFDFAPKVSVLWRAFEWGNIYATYAQGGKSGGFNALALRPDETQFRPEKAHTFEAGLKTEFWDNRVRLNVGVFRTHFTDLQTTIFNGIDIIVVNAPKALTQGVELDLNAIFDFGLTLIGSAALLDGRYKDFKDGPCLSQDIVLVVLQTERPTCDMTDRRIANAPRMQASLSANYTTPIFNWPYDFFIGGDLIFQGDTDLQTDLDEKDRQDAYLFLNGRAGINTADGRLSFSVNVRNITNKPVKILSIDAPLFANTHVAGGDMPRTITGHVTIKY